MVEPSEAAFLEVQSLQAILTGNGEFQLDSLSPVQFRVCVSVCSANRRQQVSALFFLPEAYPVHALTVCVHIDHNEGNASRMLKPRLQQVPAHQWRGVLRAWFAGGV
jgi:hypothetical protein